MDAHTRSISDLLADRLRADGDKPLITAYDTDTGARTELSVATTDNWASKAANHLVEDLGVKRGDHVGMLLDTAWTTPLLLLACWRVGAVPLAGGWRGRAERPAVMFVAEDRLAELPEGPGNTPEVLVVGRGLGARLSPAAPAEAGALRLFADEVLAFADDYDDPELDGGAAGWADPPLSQTALLERTAGWPGGARVLSTAPAAALDGALALLGALATDGSLVLVRTGGSQGDDIGESVERIARDERVTHLHDGATPPRPC